MSSFFGTVRKLLRFIARSIAFPAAEAVWAGLFALLGRNIRDKPKLWTSQGQERVLVVAPHPDDETLGCGRTIALHCAAGDSVSVVIVTDGGASKAGGLMRAEMIALRAKEAHEAINELGAIEMVQLGLPEGGWSEAELLTHLEAIIRDFRPTLIYATSCIDYHPEHIKVAGALAQALQKESRTCRSVRVYEVQTPLTAQLINLVAETHTVATRKIAALSKYVSQVGSLGWSYREERYLARLFGRKGSVEVFWELSSAQYVKLMAAGQRLQESGSGFRGLQPRPFSDGLVWIVGRRPRRYLKRAAMQK